jgi:predicted transcriptional regulator YdeE
MRISSGLRGFGASVAGGAKENSTLKKSEVVADLFNNPLSLEEGRKDVKLRLSNSSRKLTLELEQKVEHFLGENQEIKEKLAEIELPESAYAQTDPNEQPVRKIAAYLHWLNIHEARETEPEEQEAPFLAINAAGKNEELRAIVHEQNEKRQLLQNERKKHAPSYYYQAYPEAYAFN